MKYCDDCAALLDLYVDGELTAEEALFVQAHLDSCPACRSYVDDALAIRAAFPDAEDTPVPDGFAASVMAAIRSGAAPQKSARSWVKVLAPLAACCALVILLRHSPLSGRNESAAQEAAYCTAAATADSVPQAPAEEPAATEAAEDANWDALAESFRPGAQAETHGEGHPADNGGEMAAAAEETDIAAGGMSREYAQNATAQDADIVTTAPADTFSPAAGGTLSGEESSATLPWDGSTIREGAEAETDTSSGPRITLTTEEAGDLLANYMPVAETRTELHYQLTQEQYESLLSALPDEIRWSSPVSPGSGALVIVQKQEKPGS